MRDLELSSLESQDTSATEEFKAQLLADYAPLVSHIARRIASRLPAHVELDDLISTGFIGLLEAIENFDPSLNNKFKTYGTWRIRGAILDELRGLDLVPRSVRDKIKYKIKVENELEQKFGRRATDMEISEALGLDQKKYQKFINRYVSPVEVSYSKYNFQTEQTYSSEPLDPLSLVTIEDQLLASEKNAKLIFYMNTLPKQHYMVLHLYFFYSLNLKECAYVLDLSESRISQIRKNALEKLKAKLKRSYLDDAI